MSLVLSAAHHHIPCRASECLLYYLLHITISHVEHLNVSCTICCTSHYPMKSILMSLVLYAAYHPIPCRASECLLYYLLHITLSYEEHLIVSCTICCTSPYHILINFHFHSKRQHAAKQIQAGNLDTHSKKYILSKSICVPHNNAHGSCTAQTVKITDNMKF